MENPSTATGVDPEFGKGGCTLFKKVEDQVKKEKEKMEACVGDILSPFILSQSYTA